MRYINDAGIALIKKFEGCALKAYPDPGSGGDPWTVGYGHTGQDVRPDSEITQESADAILASDLNRFETGLEALLTADLNDNQFSALICFAFNVGLHNLASSTLLKCVNNEDFTTAADQFLRWNRAAGHVMNGLTARREAERDLFLS